MFAGDVDAHESRDSVCYPSLHHAQPLADVFEFQKSR